MKKWWYFISISTEAPRCTGFVVWGMRAWSDQIAIKPRTTSTWAESSCTKWRRAMGPWQVGNVECHGLQWIEGGKPVLKLMIIPLVLGMDWSSGFSSALVFFCWRASNASLSSCFFCNISAGKAGQANVTEVLGVAGASGRAATSAGGWRLEMQWPLMFCFGTQNTSWILGGTNTLTPTTEV